MSLHHTQQQFCPLCIQKLEQVHPVLKDFFTIIKQEFPDCHISCGFRNKEDQNAAYLEHKTRLKFPLSPHNQMRQGEIPCSRALDLFELDHSYHAKFDPKFYFRIADFMKNRWPQTKHCPCEWSGDWSLEKDKFVETNHFQLKDEI